ncbi:MAG: tetratricopeptide repeat protein [Magnetospirillum sp.]|nr:tetratricopeptide repeat protein [Magnetospirillum sp.]
MSTRRLSGPRLLLSAAILGVAMAGLAAGAAPGLAGDTAAVEKAEKPGDPTFARLFEEGVGFMREGRVHEAVVVFEAARKRQPKVPEVSVNLGFAHLAAKNFPAAEREFEQALIVSPQQANAYYGLALALEQQGDVELALGAMRTFLHLEKTETPFTRKGSAAIWEWEEELRVKREGTPTEIPPGSVGALDHQKVTSPEQLRKDYVPKEAAK